MKFLLISIFSFVYCAIGNDCIAQVFQEIIPGNTANYGAFHTNDLLVMGQSDYVDMDNADIEGSPFWNNEWKSALLYTGDYAIFIQKAKLNLYKNKVYYINNDGQTMIAKTGQVKKIEFFNGNDTSHLLADFVYLDID